MSAPNVSNFEKVREEHVKHIFDHYKDQSKIFGAALNLLLSFALLFFLLILLPYVQILHEEQQTVREQHDTSTSIEDLEGSIKEYQAVQQVIEDLTSTIDDGPEELRRYIENLVRMERETIEQPMIQQNQLTTQQVRPQAFNQQFPSLSEPCGLSSNHTMLDCMIHDEVISLFRGSQETFTEQVDTPLRNLGINGLTEEELDDAFDNLLIRVNQKLNENPGFWGYYTGKINFFDELDDFFHEIRTPYVSIINEQSEILNNRLVELRVRLDTLYQREEILEERTEILSSRLSQIHSPYGRLPLTLNEAIYAFPIVLALAWFILLTILLNLIHLRWHFQTQYQQRDPNREFLTNEQIVLIAPLWVDPLGSRQNSLAQHSLLAVPVLTFVAACSLSFYCSRLTSETKDALLVKWELYAVLYAVAAIIITYGYIRLILKIRNYSRVESVSTATAPPIFISQGNNPT